jgi:hypothetical protein
MATRIQIEKNIEKNRENLVHDVDEMKKIVKDYLGIKKQIEKKPGNIILAATFIGFSIALLGTKTGRSILGKLIKPVTAIGTVYLSKKASGFLKKSFFY